MNLGKSVHCRLLCAVLFPYHNERRRLSGNSCFHGRTPTHRPTRRRPRFLRPPLFFLPARPCYRPCRRGEAASEVVCTLGSDMCVYCRSRGHDLDRFTHPFHVGFLSIRSMSDQLSVFPPFPRNSTLGRAKGPSLAHAPIRRAARIAARASSLSDFLRSSALFMMPPS